jgi:hypothetical protein
LGVIPAYDVAESDIVTPLTRSEKLRLFWLRLKDPVSSLGPGLQAGIEQRRNANSGFGGGADGFFKRYGSAWADATTGRLFRNSICPILLHEDPRYFRRGASSSSGGRTGYALTRVFVTRTDSQANSFNWAKLLASFSSGAVSNLYYPKQNRGLGLTLTNVGISYVTEMGLNALKEFWPDLKHLPSRNRKAADVDSLAASNGTLGQLPGRE